MYIILFCLLSTPIHFSYLYQHLLIPCVYIPLFFVINFSHVWCKHSMYIYMFLFVFISVYLTICEQNRFPSWGLNWNFKVSRWLFLSFMFGLCNSCPWVAHKLERTDTGHITLDPRLSFPDSVGGIFPGPATTQKVYRGIEWFFQLAGLQWSTVLSVLIRGITITLTGDWHSGRRADLSPIMLRNCLLTDGKIWHISVLWMWWLTKMMFQLLNTLCQLYRNEFCFIRF